MFTYKLLSGGLTRQTPTSSRFACKYARLEVFAGLRKLHSNEAIRGISWGKILFAPNIIKIVISILDKLQKIKFVRKSFDVGG